MGSYAKASAAIVVAWLALFQGFLVAVNGQFDYKEALTKSLLFLEAQRSGKLPPTKRVPWRGDSALNDGKDVDADLSGGYYDAGDNVKYGLPMAFTITTLSWAAIFYKSELEAAGELKNTHAAIRWGTDYFLKASSRHKRLYVQVGDPVQDHQCWIRPENMQTPRTVLKIDEDTPGTEIAAETSAAMAASSIVFRSTDHPYSHHLLNKAKWLFQLAKTHKGSFDGECPFYCSYSGYNDELLWAAAWLYRATKSPLYLKFIQEESISASVAEFSWDLKYAGAQVLLTEMFLGGEKSFLNFQNQANSFVCSVLPQSPYHQIYISPGGLVHMRDGANTQYATGTALLFSIYGDVLAKHNQKVPCGSEQFGPDKLLAFAKQQIDYLLGKNPQKRSYMVGYGTSSPKQAHHRGASVPILAKDATVSCSQTFQEWFNVDTPNPNELTGAIVGGPDRYDNFDDKRWDSPKTEPTTYTNSLSVGALARLASQRA